MGSPIVVLDSVCPGVAVETLGGPAFEPLECNGPSAQFLSGFIAFAKPLSASLGHWASAWLQEEPSSLCSEQEGDQEFPCLFCVALTHPFRSEGGVEYARLPSVGASSDTSGELLSGKSKWRPVPHSIGVS